MSRIIIKNLPKNTKEDTLRSKCESIGTVTDCSLKFGPNGKFRCFAFVGFKFDAEAKRAVKNLNRTYIDTSRLTVELCKDFGDDNKPRAWSKYSKDSSAFANEIKQPNESSENKKSTSQSNKKSDDPLGELKENTEFTEFLEAHKNRTAKSTWSNDDSAKQGVAVAKTDEPQKDEVKKEKKKKKVEKSDGVSDLDYLKTKVSKSKSLEDDVEEEVKVKMEVDTSDEDGDEDDDDDSSSSSEDESSSSSDDDADAKVKDSKKKIKEEPVEKEKATSYILNMKGIPGTSSIETIKTFFQPIPVKKIKRNNLKNNTSGVAQIEFHNEKDWNSAMRRNKNFINSTKIYLFKLKQEDESDKPKLVKEWCNNKAQGESSRVDVVDGSEQESIAETGRIFIRNLAYCCKEEDVENLFKKFGPLTETLLPLDKQTRKIKGFAFVTFMMPENAHKAFTKLDGTSFMGRMLHLIPAKPKKEDTIEVTDETSYKKKKEAEKKASASSSHNWNSLFLGQNAVAELMAAKYGTDKSEILSSEGATSAGVRLALGETQIISETREFLIKEGIALDSFSQAAGERSKTVILVKNLPAATTREEIVELFSASGRLGRVVLPSSGITAVVEFAEPTEARSAFRSLAYTKFKYMPLYLEWAPMGIFSKEKAPPKEEAGSDDESESSSESEDEIIPESTLFIKNLNFETKEETLSKMFTKCGTLKGISISTKQDAKNPGSLLSMGYGFIQYKSARDAKSAMKRFQHKDIDGHRIELKISNRDTLQNQNKSYKKKQDVNKKRSSKILIRNIPFEAKTKELKDIFSVFGELKSLRLPKKLSGTGSHRGFAFAQYESRKDSKRAFNALCHSTHLYGRRLVLEWADEAEDINELRKKTASHFHDEPASKKLKRTELMDTLNPEREKM